MYLVLARKYRPRSFEDLVGQESVSRGLAQAIASGRIGHAFLFIGSRGTGKTSSARILARALNCEKGPTPTPCGACDSCRAIEEGNDVDVLEIDAASNNGVENVRELRERVAYRPMRGRFRITILDEVHMLSGGAFNALLKTLEEPPPHAKFVFATTAPEKIPETIRSRCQVFEFRRIEEPAIVARLAEVCRREGATVAEPILASIARVARGGMRDSLSLLDQLLAFSGQEPTEADLAAVTGTAGRDDVLALGAAILGGDRAEVLRRVAAHASSGGEMLELVTQLAEHFRSLLALSVCGPETDVVTELGELRLRLTAQAESSDADRLEAIVRHLVHARERARQAGPLSRASVESALLAASRAGEVATVGALLARLESMERRLGTGATAPAPSGASAAPRIVRPASPPAPAQGAPARARAAEPQPARAVGSAGANPAAGPCSAEELLQLLGQRGRKFDCILRDRRTAAVLEGTTLRVRLPELSPLERGLVDDEANRRGAERHLATRLAGIRIEIAHGDEPAPQAGKASSGAAGGAPQGTPPPAVLAVAERTRGRIVGRVAPPDDRPPEANRAPHGSQAPHQAQGGKTP